uniref:Secreted protein n=1 Tax=Panstrongylus lignarius TaxID=156445 RepID=A0A224XRY0_9HEMI
MHHLHHIHIIITTIIRVRLARLVEIRLCRLHRLRQLFTHIHIITIILKRLDYIRRHICQQISQLVLVRHLYLLHLLWPLLIAIMVHH